jgi:4-amino-4-deoxy-L-arabinose transferase-like glycosyltransferase
MGLARQFANCCCGKTDNQRSSRIGCINGNVSTTYEAPCAATDKSEPRHLGSISPRLREAVALALVLLVTAVLYLWNIAINGMGNQFYAGAAFSGAQNWEALLFGSLDPRNFITVDKPPVSQWVMGLSGQLFGFSSTSMLVPQALMGVAAVALLYATVRRISGPTAALLAASALALTPVAALMFRFNNPDAVMVLLMTGGAYCTVRAIHHASPRWIGVAGVALGFAFLAKMLEGLMVMPAFGLAYLMAAPASLSRRLWHLLGAVAALTVSAGWFVVLTLLWPASSRPYLAGSTDNSFMDLVLGYNGLARVFGHQHLDFEPPTSGPAAEAFRNGGRWHESHGFARLFSGEFGFQIGWLLPTALLAIIWVLFARRREPRTDVVRAGVIVFGGWLVVNGLVLSFMSGMHGMIPPYYCLSLAPAVAAMFAIGIVEMWRHRDRRSHRIGLVCVVFVTGAWGWWILGRNAGWLPPLRWIILAATVAAAAALCKSLFSDARHQWAVASLTIALIAGLAGSTAYAVATVGQPHGAGGAWVGPASADPINGPRWWHDLDFLDNPQLQDMLRATHTEWSAAIKRSSPAAALELATRTPVMAVGGFLGIDPVPTLRQFQDYVAHHRIGYYIVPDPNDDYFPVGRDAHTDIANWVADNFESKKVGTDTVYDLSAPTKRQ